MAVPYFVTVIEEGSRQLAALQPRSGGGGGDDLLQRSALYGRVLAAVQMLTYMLITHITHTSHTSRTSRTKRTTPL